MPSPHAAALANVMQAPSRSFSMSRPGTAESRHWRRAYEGLPGPANTYRAALTRASIVSYSNGVAVVRSRKLATSMGKPTLCLKYVLARSQMSSAFSWNPNGVSSSTAGTGGGPRRARRSACTETMVGAVSPEPITQRMRGN